jgi:signal transduction histidine kinase
MSDDKKPMNEADDQLRQLRKNAGVHDDTVKDLHNARSALESERSGRELERDRAQSDIQELKQNLIEERSERQLEQNEASTLIGDMDREKAERMRFFTIISHDLRSPIANLTGFLQQLLAEFDDLNPEQVKARILRLEVIVQRLSHLTESLLTWTKHKLDRFQCEYQYIDLKALTDENVELFSESCTQKGISLISTLNEAVTAYADVDMINAAMRNIVSNAIRFTHEKGTIRIGAESKEDGIVLSVSDNGMGIAEVRLRTLFDPAPNRALSSAGTGGERGAGLGLLLCKELVEKNGGTIWLESQEGRGTTVFVKLQRFAPGTTNQRRI